MLDSKINFYSSKDYYQFAFFKSDYYLLHAILKSSFEVFDKFRSSWPTDCSSDRINKIVSDVSELLWQLETQVEMQEYFHSKGV